MGLVLCLFSYCGFAVWRKTVYPRNGRCGVDDLDDFDGIMDEQPGFLWHFVLEGREHIRKMSKERKTTKEIRNKPPCRVLFTICYFGVFRFCVLEFIGILAEMAFLEVDLSVTTLGVEDGQDSMMALSF